MRENLTRHGEDLHGQGVVLGGRLGRTVRDMRENHGVKTPADQDFIIVQWPQ